MNAQINEETISWLVIVSQLAPKQKEMHKNFSLSDNLLLKFNENSSYVSIHFKITYFWYVFWMQDNTFDISEKMKASQFLPQAVFLYWQYRKRRQRKPTLTQLSPDPLPGPYSEWGTWKEKWKCFYLSYLKSCSKRSSWGSSLITEIGQRRLLWIVLFGYLFCFGSFCSFLSLFFNVIPSSFPFPIPFPSFYFFKLFRSFIYILEKCNAIKLSWVKILTF